MDRPAQAGIARPVPGGWLTVDYALPLSISPIAFLFARRWSGMFLSPAHVLQGRRGTSQVTCACTNVTGLHVMFGNQVADGVDEKAVTAPDAPIIPLAALASRSNTSATLASTARCQCGPSGWLSLTHSRWRRGAAGTQLQIASSPGQTSQCYAGSRENAGRGAAGFVLLLARAAARRRSARREARRRRV
jgi:hypothetical protein